MISLNLNLILFLQNYFTKSLIKVTWMALMFCKASELCGEMIAEGRNLLFPICYENSEYIIR